MPSTRIVLALALLSTGLGCSGRMETTYPDSAITPMDAASDASGFDAAAPIDAALIDAASADAGSADAPSPTDTRTDAHVTPTGDAGCTPPVCATLPSSCHYDTSLDPCRCGMIVCTPPTMGCSPACGARQFCEYPADTCGASGGGACTTIPDACLDNFDPVCGCDGHTYSNACQAQAAGQNVVYHSACETPADCRTTSCPRGSACVPCRGSGYICLASGTVC